MCSHKEPLLFSEEPTCRKTHLTDADRFIQVIDTFIAVYISVLVVLYLVICAYSEPS